MPDRNQDTTCIECAHFYIVDGETHYSDLTPGSDAEMCCRKKHFDDNLAQISEVEYRSNMRKARECQDFKRREPDWMEPE